MKRMGLVGKVCARAPKPVAVAAVAANPPRRNVRLFATMLFPPLMRGASAAAARWATQNRVGLSRDESGATTLRDAGGAGKRAARLRDDRAWFAAILAELTEVAGSIFAGPTGPRQDFEKHVRIGHAEEFANKLVGVEAMDEPSDGELLRGARKRLPS
jgi:hypothetical protein